MRGREGKKGNILIHVTNRVLGMRWKTVDARSTASYAQCYLLIQSTDFTISTRRYARRCKSRAMANSLHQEVTCSCLFRPLGLKRGFKFPPQALGFRRSKVSKVHRSLKSGVADHRALDLTQNGRGFSMSPYLDFVRIGFRLRLCAQSVIAYWRHIYHARIIYSRVIYFRTSSRL